MKRVPILIVLPLLLCGCVPKSKVDEARADLAKARQQVETLQIQRVPRPQYDAAQSSLRAAAKRIAELEHELQTARGQIAALEGVKLSEGPATGSQTDKAPESAPQGLAKGTYEQSNGAFVYSPDALLNFSKDLQVTSPTGLMVSDPEQKVVAGELKIKTSKAVSLETPDGVLSSQPDGTVTFTGSSLIMKFDDKAPPQPPASEGTHPAGASPVVPPAAEQ